MIEKTRYLLDPEKRVVGFQFYNKDTGETELHILKSSSVKVSQVSPNQLQAIIEESKKTSIPYNERAAMRGEYKGRVIQIHDETLLELPLEDGGLEKFAVHVGFKELRPWQKEALKVIAKKTEPKFEVGDSVYCATEEEYEDQSINIEEGNKGSVIDIDKNYISISRNNLKDFKKFEDKLRR